MDDREEIVEHCSGSEELILGTKTRNGVDAYMVFETVRRRKRQQLNTDSLEQRQENAAKNTDQQISSETKHEKNSRALKKEGKD